MHGVVFSYGLSAMCRVAIYSLSAVLLVSAAFTRRYVLDRWALVLLALLAANSLLAFLGVSRTLVGAIATPIACVLAGYVLARQRRA